MRKLIPATVLLLLSWLPVQAGGSMAKDLPATLHRAMGLCFDVIDGKSPRNLGPFKKTATGFVRTFPEGTPGVLPDNITLNGSAEPRVEIFVKKSQPSCTIYVMRLDGGYKLIGAQLRASAAQFGWTYTRKNFQPLSKDGRSLSFKGSSGPSGSGNSKPLISFSMSE